MPNDFERFFRENSNITHVFFNGGKAEEAFRRHTSPSKHKLHRLPSTSPLYAAMPLEEKVKAWSVVRAVLSEARS